jgi:predicted alpha/beta superfamily hydrolase
MRRYILISLAIKIILMLAAAATANAQTNNAGTAAMLTMKGDMVKSTVNNKTYQLYVSLPKNYNVADTMRYPVLYVLDGQYAFPSFFSIRENLDMAREIDNVIIVAIADSSQSESAWIISRYFDYTPSHMPQMDSLWPKIMNVPAGSLISGGAQSFLFTIQKNIIPFIEEHYKTNSSRGISGHSLGGLFASYCLLTAPGLFNSYGINSPALWWNNKEILTLEDAFAKQHTALAANVFVSVGSLEGEMMVGPITAFAQSLINHNYQGLTVKSQIFDNETHVSVSAASSSRTLRVLYNPKVK